VGHPVLLIFLKKNAAALYLHVYDDVFKSGTSVQLCVAAS